MGKDSIFEFRGTGKEMMIGLKNSENGKQDKKLLNFNKERKVLFVKHCYKSLLQNHSYMDYLLQNNHKSSKMMLQRRRQRMKLMTNIQ